jgi:hypothetical protein
MEIGFGVVQDGEFVINAEGFYLAPSCWERKMKHEQGEEILKRISERVNGWRRRER